MYIRFDPDKAPDAVRKVVVVKGSLYEMGFQYGQQARELIERNAAVLKGEIIPKWGSWEKVVSLLDMYENIVDEKTPEVVDFWHAIAEGADTDYDNIRIINLSLQLLIMPLDESAEGKKMQTCSNMSVWGKATADGRMIAGANMDQGWNAGTYTVVIVGFPDEGKNFITTPAWAGEVVGNFCMNSDGLMLLGSGGQDARDDDMTIGYPNFMAKFGCLLHSSSAKEAVDYYLGLECSSAENAHFVDEKEAFIVEYTPAHHVVRKMGMQGEEDYMIAANHFVADDMQDSNYDGELGEGWADSPYRYASYERQIREADGNVSVEDVMRIMGSRGYYKDGNWTGDIYNADFAPAPEGVYPIEGRDVEWKTLIRGIGIPEDRMVWLMQGQGDRRMSVVPYATGQYCKLHLADDLETLIADAMQDAKLMIWEAARDLNLAGRTDNYLDQMLEEAKADLWRAFNHKALARCSDDENEKAMEFGTALTALCRAHNYSQLASQLIRER